MVLGLQSPQFPLAFLHEYKMAATVPDITQMFKRWPVWSLPLDPRAYQPGPHPPETLKLFLLWEPATYLAPPSLGYIPEVRRGRRGTG